MTPSEAHGVITTLKLFTLYEVKAGVDYWGSRVMNEFPRPCIQRLAATISYTEMGVHAPFYNKLNEALNLNTEEFYLGYKTDPILKARMDYVKELISSKDPLLSVGAFSMIEGAVLYSSFAFLLHFQARGMNKLNNVCRGIKFSVRDENLHAIAGALIARQVLKETGQEAKVALVGLYDVAKQIQEHEHEIIDMIFEKGPMDGITPEGMKQFVNHRINLCLENLGLDKILDETKNPIKEWFYPMINSVQLHDFFAGVGNEYNRDWDSTKFTW